MVCEREKYVGYGKFPHSLANSRPAWVSYLNIAVLIGTLSLALFNASKDEVARNFAYAYAIISVIVLVSHCDNYLFLQRSYSVSRFMGMLYTNGE